MKTKRDTWKVEAYEIIILRNRHDVIYYLNMSCKTGDLLALDYCKTFDSVFKDFIKEIFKLFGFGEEFTKWVETSFSNTVAWIRLAFRAVQCKLRDKARVSIFTTGLCVSAVEIWGINIRNSSIKGTELPKLKDFHLEWVGKLANLEKRNGF